MTDDDYKTMILGSALRHIFGPIFRGEPTINFNVDGMVKVIIGECSATISKEIAELIYQDAIK